GEERGVGALPAAPDASAQLVELAQSESLRAVHDQRVDRRQVDPGFYDRRADQHVETTLPEIDHDAFERALVQLAVRDSDARVGHQLAQSSSGLVNVG